MPKIVKTQNHLKIELIKGITSLFLLWFSSLALMIFLDAISYLPYFGIFILSFVGIFTAYLSRKLKVCLSGLNGENKAISMVKEIPSHYTVFSNTILTYEGKRSETDLIVVGEKGVFLIEVKNHLGVITGKEEDRNWTQFKETPNGGRYANPFYNPVKQVKTHIYRLAGILKDASFNGWIQGVVYFANPETKVQTTTKHIPVLDAHSSFVDFLEQFEPKKYLKETEQNIITEAIHKQIANEVNH